MNKKTMHYKSIMRDNWGTGRNHFIRRSIAGLLLLILFAGCGYSPPLKKNNYYVVVDITLRGASGEPLANYDFLSASGLLYKAQRPTDENGRYREVVTRNNSLSTIWIWEHITPPRKVPPLDARLEFVLPEVHPEGIYTVHLIPEPEPRGAGPGPEAGLDRHAEIPVTLEPGEGKEVGITNVSRIAHGARYIEGRLTSVFVWTNGKDIRRIPMIPQHDVEQTGMVNASTAPHLQIVAETTPLERRRGWHLKIDLALMNPKPR